MTALPINLWFGAVCGAVLCAFTPASAPDREPVAAGARAPSRVRAGRAARAGARTPSAVRRQALRVVLAFAGLALAPAAAYLQAIFPDWSVLYVLPAGALLDTALKRMMAPLFAAIAVVASALLGWLLAEAASAFALSRRGADRHGDPADEPSQTREPTDAVTGILARLFSPRQLPDRFFARGLGRGLARGLGRLLGRLLGSARSVRWLTAVLLAAVGALVALLARGRLGIVGSYEQFHADRWLMQPLLSAATKLPFALAVINLGILISLGMAARLLRWRSDLLALSVSGPVPAAPSPQARLATDPAASAFGPSSLASPGAPIRPPDPAADALPSPSASPSPGPSPDPSPDPLADLSP